MEIEEHHKEFQGIVAKYSFDKRADELTDAVIGTITAEEFSQKFGTTIDEAQIFLSFIQKGISYKESLRE